MGMSPFSIVYRKVSYHVLGLAKLLIGVKFSDATSDMADQVIDVQKEFQVRLEKSNTRYKATTDKRERRSSKKETW